MRTLIATRLSRLAEGLPGDIAPVGNGISDFEFTTAPAIASICNSAVRFS